MENLKKAMIIRNGNVVGAVGDKNFSTAPIGTVLAYAGNEAPRGYLLADGASYPTAEYPDLYAVIGNTYGGDSTNFNVPNLVDKFIQGSSTSGTEKEAGLPNIKGTFYHDTNATSSLSGAFFSYTRGNSQNLKNDDGNKNSGYVSFDASKSNPIYGNSDTVQPPALTMVYIIKAFHTNEGTDSNDVTDQIVEYVEGEIAEVETELKGNIEELSSNLGEKVDYKVVVEDGNRYVEDIVVQEINTWLPNDNSSILINLKKLNGKKYDNFQLLCNKKDSKNWSCIVNGAANELWKIRYIDGVRYIDELATMDKVTKYPDWSNQQKINQTEITLDQDVYIELNQLNSEPIDALKINGKDVSIYDSSNGLHSTKFSGYVKKGSVVSYPYLTYENFVRVFPLV